MNKRKFKIYTQHVDDMWKYLHRQNNILVLYSRTDNNPDSKDIFQIYTSIASNETLTAFALAVPLTVV